MSNPPQLELKEIAEKVGESIADIFGNAFEAMLKGEDVIKSIGEGLRHNKIINKA